MCGWIIGFVIAIGAVSLGLKGFKPEGLPLSRTKNLTGRPARVVGVACIAFGLLLFLLQAALLVLEGLVREGVVPPPARWF